MDRWSGLWAQASASDKEDGMAGIIMTAVFLGGIALLAVGLTHSANRSDDAEQLEYIRQWKMEHTDEK